MQKMSWQEQGYGYRGGWEHHRHPGFFILPLLLVGFLFFTALKFLWPLLLIGLVFMVVRKAMMHHVMMHGDWSPEGRERFKEKMQERMRRGGPWHGGHGGWHPGHHGQHRHGHHGPWGWDSNEESPKRKNDEDDDKPKRDGNTLYV